MSEHRLWVECRDIITGPLRGHASRIESHETASGFPDTNFCISSREYNMELKYSDDHKMCEVRPTQVRWFVRRIKAGALPFFLIKIKNRQKHYIFIRGEFAHNIAMIKNNEDLLKFKPSYQCMELNSHTLIEGIEHCTFKEN